MRDFGILGMNARNLQYIKKFNSKKAIRLADNKLKTRRFMEARGIPVPETFDVIRSRHQLYTYNFRHLPVDEFIVKPNKGSRGRGIYRVKVQDRLPRIQKELSRIQRAMTLRSPYRFEQYTISGKTVDDGSFRRYLMDILDGKNSIGLRNDTILLEELLLPGSGFERYCEWGLADIRVIVHNLVPVAAMLRVPTQESDGKANLDRGAIGFGVEVGTGKIISLYHHGRVYTKKFPKQRSSFEQRTLPYREDILMYSSKIQYFVNLGFLALDWVITEDGPKLLEINARAGLKFQLASMLPLKQRLKKIGDIKVTTPEKGVEIAQSLFVESKSHFVTQAKILYLSQDGKLVIGSGKEKQVHECIVEVDVTKKKNYISSNLGVLLGEEAYTLRISHNNIQFTDIRLQTSTSPHKNKIILGRDTVSKYYVKPIHKVNVHIDFIAPKHIEISEVDQLHVLDKKIARLGKVLNISRILKPVNFLDELDQFVSAQGKYNPRFEYRWPADSLLNSVTDELHQLKKDYFGINGLTSNFAKLFDQKIDFLRRKCAFIEAYKSQDLDKMHQANIHLYGDLDGELIALSKEKILGNDSVPTDDQGLVLPVWKVKQLIESYLKERSIKNVKVVFDSNSISRMSVSRGRQIVFRVNHELAYTEAMLRSILAHEVDVHIMRHQAGVKTGWEIMKSGTAGYIVDEEGLAVYHSIQALGNGGMRMGMYEKYHLLTTAGFKDFAGIAESSRVINDRSLVGAFKSAFRYKKGLEQTFRTGKGTVFYKNKIYLEGYQKVTQRIESGGDVKQLMIGKVKIEDLDYIL